MIHGSSLSIRQYTRNVACRLLRGEREVHAGNAKKILLALLTHYPSDGELVALLSKVGGDVEESRFESSRIESSRLESRRYFGDPNSPRRGEPRFESKYLDPTPRHHFTPRLTDPTNRSPQRSILHSARAVPFHASPASSLYQRRRFELSSSEDDDAIPKVQQLETKIAHPKSSPKLPTQEEAPRSKFFQEGAEKFVKPTKISKSICTTQKVAVEALADPPRRISTVVSKVGNITLQPPPLKRTLRLAWQRWQLALAKRRAAGKVLGIAQACNLVSKLLDRRCHHALALLKRREVSSSHFAGCLRMVEFVKKREILSLEFFFSRIRKSPHRFLQSTISVLQKPVLGNCAHALRRLTTNRLFHRHEAELAAVVENVRFEYDRVVARARRVERQNEQWRLGRVRQRCVQSCWAEWRQQAVVSRKVVGQLTTLMSVLETHRRLQLTRAIACMQMRTRKKLFFPHHIMASAVRRVTGSALTALRMHALEARRAEGEERLILTRFESKKIARNFFAWKLKLRRNLAVGKLGSLVQTKLLRSALGCITQFSWKSDIISALQECDLWRSRMKRGSELTVKILSRSEARSDSRVVLIALSGWKLQTQKTKMGLIGFFRFVAKISQQGAWAILQGNAREKSKKIASIDLLAMRLTGTLQRRTLSHLHIALKLLNENRVQRTLLALDRKFRSEVAVRENTAREAELELARVIGKGNRIAHQNEQLQAQLLLSQAQQQRDARECESLLFKLGALQQAELQLTEVRAQNEKLQMGLETAQRDLHLEATQRAEIVRLTEKLAELSRLNSSVSFYKSKCLLQAEQIGTLQSKLRDSTVDSNYDGHVVYASPRNSRDKIFASPVNSQDITYESRSLVNLQKAVDRSASISKIRSRVEQSRFSTTSPDLTGRSNRLLR